MKKYIFLAILLICFAAISRGQYEKPGTGGSGSTNAESLQGSEIDTSGLSDTYILEYDVGTDTWVAVANSGGSGTADTVWIIQGTDSINSVGKAIRVFAHGGLNFTIDGDSAFIYPDTASVSGLGIAQFNTDYFSVSSGIVTLADSIRGENVVDSSLELKDFKAVDLPADSDFAMANLADNSIEWQSPTEMWSMFSSHGFDSVAYANHSDSAFKAVRDDADNKISDTYLSKQGGSMIGTLAGADSLTADTIIALYHAYRTIVHADSEFVISGNMFAIPGYPDPYDNYVLAKDSINDSLKWVENGSGTGWDWADSAGEPPFWVDSATHATHSDLSDSTLAIDTTNTGFTTYVTNHAGADNDSLTDSTMACALDMNSKDIHNVNDLDIENSIIIDGDTISTIHSTVIAGADSGYVLKMIITGSDTTYEFKAETGGAGSVDIVSFAVDDGEDVTSEANTVYLFAGQNIAIDTIAGNPDSLEINASDSVAIADSSLQTNIPQADTSLQATIPHADSSDVAASAYTADTSTQASIPLADSALAIDTTNTGFTNYVTNHAGADNDSLTDSTMACALDMNSKDIHNVNDLDIENSIIIDGDTISSIHSTVIAGADSGYVLKMIIEGSDTTYEFLVEAGASGTVDSFYVIFTDSASVQSGDNYVNGFLTPGDTLYVDTTGGASTDSSTVYGWLSWLQDSSAQSDTSLQTTIPHADSSDDAAHAYLADSSSQASIPTADTSLQATIPHADSSDVTASAYSADTSLQSTIPNAAEADTSLQGTIPHSVASDSALQADTSLQASIPLADSASTVADDAITPDKMADGDFGDFTFTTGDAALDVSVIDSGQVTQNAIKGWHIAAKTIDNSDIADSSITGLNIGSDVINPPHVGSGIFQFDAGIFDDSISVGGGGYFSEIYAVQGTPTDGYVPVMDATADPDTIEWLDITAIAGWGAVVDTAELHDTLANYLDTASIHDSLDVLRGEFMKDDGDTVTGRYDLGGAELEIPNGDNPTVDVAGEIAWENDDECLRVFDGNTNRAINTYKYFSATIFNPELVQDTVDNIPLLPVEAPWAPFGIVVTKVGVKTDASSSYSVIFEEWTDPTTQSSDIDTVATSSSTEASGTPSDTLIAEGSILMIDLPTTDVKWVQVWGSYYIKTGD